MTHYKVGEKVRVRTNFKLGDKIDGCRVNSPLHSQKGKCVTIKSEYKRVNKVQHRYTIEESGSVYTHEMFDPLGDIDEFINTFEL